MLPLHSNHSNLTKNGALLTILKRFNGKWLTCWVTLYMHSYTAAGKKTTA